MDRPANDSPWCSRHELYHGHCEAVQHEILVSCATFIFRGMGLAKSVRINLLRDLACVGAISFLSFGCTTMELPEYKAEQIEQYSNSQTKNELSLAVHPIVDETESEKYFGVSLLDSSILALFVVAENRGTSSSFVISKEDFVLVNTHILSDKLSRGQLAGSEGVGIAVSLTGYILPLPFISPLLVIAGAKMTSDVTVIKHNMTVKELGKKTISPGGRAEGFVYFELPKDSGESTDSFSLSVDTMRLQDRSLTRFQFEFGIKR